MHSEASIFFTANADRSVEIFLFDGFKLNPIIRDAEVVRENVPVTEGNWFVIFFVKEDYVPAVEVLQRGRENIRLGKIRLEKTIDKGEGFLTGVVYKPVCGGKISFRKGILKLLEGVNIKVISDRGESYLIKSGDNGVFSAPLMVGKYKIFVGDNQKVLDVLIEEGKTTIQNLQKGIMLID